MVPNPWMAEAAVNAGIALGAAAAGAFVTRWWNRARPLVVLSGFGDIVRSTTQIQSPEDLLKVTSESTSIPNPAPIVEPYQLLELREAATVGALRYKTAVEKLPQLRQQLTEAPDDATAIDTIMQVLSHSGIAEGISVALKRSKFSLPDTTPSVDGEKIPVTESDEDDGCYLIGWKSGTSTFSSRLLRQPFLKTRIGPFMNAVRYLNRPVLIQALDGVFPFLQHQLQVHAEIVNIVARMVDANSRWAARLLIANYGAAPMIIWPDAVLRVQGKGRGTFAVDTYLAVEGSGDALVDLAGVHVLAPGEKLTVWAITRDIQQNLKEGHLLRAHYVARDAEAVVHLKVTRRGTFGSKAASNSAVFYESLTAPSRSRAA